MANTSEVVFYNTTIETSNAPGYIGQSLIQPLGWLNTLGGTSSGMYEFGTVEISGVNNTPTRASWATSLTTPILNDNTAITTLNFTQGNDGWDPFPLLIANDALVSYNFQSFNNVKVVGVKNSIFISNINSETEIEIYSLEGRLIKTVTINRDSDIILNPGFWIVKIKDNEGEKSIKVITN